MLTAQKHVQQNYGKVQDRRDTFEKNLQIIIKKDEFFSKCLTKLLQ